MTKKKKIVIKPISNPQRKLANKDYIILLLV